MPRQEDRRRVAHLAQALLHHREDAEFIRRAEAILDRAHDAEPARGIAFEIKHGVDHVLEDARTRDQAFLGHVANQQYRRARFLRVTHQSRGRFTHLHGRTGGRFAELRLHGLDRVDHQHLRTRRQRLLQDGLHLGLGRELERGRLEPQALRTRSNLPHRFLARDVEHRPFPAQGICRLQQQRGLADARVATQQHHGTRNQPAAQDSVEFTDPGDGAHVAFLGDVGHGATGGGARGGRARGAVATAPGRRRKRHHFEGIPGLAGRALSLPLRGPCPAITADIRRFGTSHASARASGPGPGERPAMLARAGGPAGV
jgi:hypothetical protein